MCAVHGGFKHGLRRASGPFRLRSRIDSPIPFCDGLADGFRPIAVKEAIGDRVPGAVLWNLFDIDAKFGDVETTERCLQYLDEIGGANLKNRKAA